MKYVLYIDYKASYKPMSWEYKPLEAKTVEDAIIEADQIHNLDTMYLIRIMKKVGKVDKTEGKAKTQEYKSFLEKRSTKWARLEGTDHRVKYFMTKFATWFD